MRAGGLSNRDDPRSGGGETGFDSGGFWRGGADCWSETAGGILGGGFHHAINCACDNATVEIRLRRQAIARPQCRSIGYRPFSKVRNSSTVAYSQRPKCEAVHTYEIGRAFRSVPTPNHFYPTANRSIHATAPPGNRPDRSQTVIGATLRWTISSPNHPRTSTVAARPWSAFGAALRCVKTAVPVGPNPVGACDLSPGWHEKRACIPAALRSRVGADRESMSPGPSGEPPRP
jgi:hypothetical protein